MSTHIYKVKGMRCASCASIIERTVRNIEGVKDISVNNGAEKAKITFDTGKTSHHAMNKKLKPLGYTLESENMSEHAEYLGVHQSKQEKLREVSVTRDGVLGALPIASASIFIVAWEILGTYSIVPKMSETMYEFFIMYFLFLPLLFLSPYCLSMRFRARYANSNYRRSWQGRAKWDSR